MRVRGDSLLEAWAGRFTGSQTEPTIGGPTGVIMKNKIPSHRSETKSKRTYSRAAATSESRSSVRGRRKVVASPRTTLEGTRHRGKALSRTGSGAPSRDDLDPLLAAWLSDKGVSTEVAVERGYTSAPNKAAVRALGFSSSQLTGQVVPAFVIPIYDGSGEIRYHQIRRQVPRRDRAGRPVKYETPARAIPCVDVHPWCRPHLKDPRVQLLVTEGATKADALLTAARREGIPVCIANLLGVFGWRGKSRQGGTAALPCWEDFAMKGDDGPRTVVLVFDSDVVSKPQVHHALRRLRDFLTARGAEVLVANLPQTNEAGVGVDDYLAAGHSFADLQHTVTADLPVAPARDSITSDSVAERYDEDETGVHYLKRSPEGVVTVVPLANFCARIRKNVTVDFGDDFDNTMRYEVVAFRQDGDKHREIGATTVRADQYPSMSWVARLGPQALVYPGFGTQDQLRCAIQALSIEDGIEEDRVYPHLGWRLIDGEWTYLHAGGAINAHGSVDAVDVELKGKLSAYELPTPPATSELSLLLRPSLRFLEIAPLRVTVPIYGAVFRAPLGEPPSMDFSVHVTGGTGAHKSSLVATALAHYGPTWRFDNLPAEWSSTPNALEELLWTVKDALVVIDDYAPRASAADQQRLQAAADRILRAVGNRSGRGRQSPDGGLRRTFIPRGLLLSTGEDLPMGASIRARLVITRHERTDLNIDARDAVAAAARAGELARFLSGFVRWLAPRMPEIRRKLPDELNRMASRFIHGGVAAGGTGGHDRDPRALANLALGLEYLLEFATDTCGMSQEDAAEKRREWFQALVEAGQAQHRYHLEEDPARQFLAYLSSAIATKRCFLVDAQTEGAPQDAKTLGWVASESQFTTRPDARLVGWVVPGQALLDWTAAYALATRVAAEQGRVVSLSSSTLLSHLARAGYLADRPSASREGYQLRRQVGTRQLRVVVLALETVKDGVRDSATPGDQAPRATSGSSDTVVATGSLSPELERMGASIEGDGVLV